MKPYIVCHMVTTIDGRIMGGRWGKVAGQKGSANIFETTAATYGIPSWLVGTTTMKEFAGRPIKIRKTKDKIVREDHVVTRDAMGYAIGADRKGILPWSAGHLPDGEHVVSLLTQQVSDDYLAHLESRGVSYLFCGEKEIDLRLALDKLARKFKLKKLMVQGGGAMNGSALRDGLIDEISHLTVPVADGGREIQTMFDIPGAAPAKASASLRLMSLKKLPGGVLWAKYKVIGKPTA
jgi:riboflavin biosynthesis pyrimidine reductase